jgi:hypothetical protein
MTDDARKVVDALMAADHRATTRARRQKTWRRRNALLMQCLLYPVLIAIALNGPRDMHFDEHYLAPPCPAVSHIMRPGVDPASLP